MRKLMRFVTSIISFLLLSHIAMAADNNPVIGAWNMELDFQGQPFALSLTITETSDGLAGTLGAPEFGINPVSNVVFDGAILKFEADDQQGGTVAIQLTLADGQLSGTIMSAMGDIPAKATRKI